MQLRRIAAVLTLLVAIWVILTVLPLAESGVLPYFFPPECATITIEGTGERIEVQCMDIDIEAQNAVLIVKKDTNISMNVISSVILEDMAGYTLNLAPGETETLFYLADEIIRFSRTKVSAQNASFLLSHEDGFDLVKIKSADRVEFVAYYDLGGESIPVWLSDSATMRIASTMKEIWWAWVVPRDTTRTQELFKMIDQPFGDFDGSGLSFITESIQGDFLFKEILADKTDGEVLSDKNYTLKSPDTFTFKSCNSADNLHLESDENNSTFSITAQDVYGQLWKNGIPIPENRWEKFAGSGIVAGFGVAVILLTKLVDKFLEFTHPQKEEKARTAMRASRITAVLVVVALVVASLVLISYLRGLFHWTVDPLWASVYVTIVLVVINIYYAWQSRQTIAEMAKARKAEFMPNIKALLTFLGPVYVILKVTNFGKGPAMDVRITITFSPSDKTQPIEQHVISPGETIRILLPEGNIKKIRETAAKIIVKGTYKNVFGAVFEIEDVIDTSDFIEKGMQSRRILEEDLTQLIKGIKEELERIRHAIERR